MVDFLNKFFLEKSTEFRLVSDALLQFTCGKRAEILVDRRKAVEPKDSESRRRLRLIPPSSSHLYEEDLLAKWSCATQHQPRQESQPLPRQLLKRPAPQNLNMTQVNSSKRQKLATSMKRGGESNHDHPAPKHRSFKNSSKLGSHHASHKLNKRF